MMGPMTDSLLRSFEQYDEPTLHRAIETAKDPAVAEVLVGVLGQMIAADSAIDPMDRLATASLAVVLGEAGAAGLGPVLLNRLATADSLQFIDEVFEYVLRRRGEPMIREAMQLLPTVAKPAGRAALYWVIDWAHSLSKEFQLEVAEYCVARMSAELTLPPDRNGKASWFSCCRVLITLDDDRVEGIIRQGMTDPGRRKQREAWERLETSRNDYFGKPMKVTEAFDPRLDWPVQVPKWAAEYQAIAPGATDGDPELDEMLQLVDTLTDDRSARSSQSTRPGAPSPKPPGDGPVVSRNGPCPCGSGKKYKKCCGVT